MTDPHDAETRERPAGADPHAAPTGDGGPPLPAAADGLDALRARFDLVAPLGRGGMGAVWRARERTSGREVALKVVRAALDERTRARFRREAELTAALRHVGIVRVHDAGEDGGVPWIAYELVEGARPLTTVAAERPLRERVLLVRDAARALGHAHRQGVLHRDVKPDNLLVGEDGRVRVGDFGLAVAEGLLALTRTGAVVGTPYYLAPETLARGEQTAAVDVWALGLVLYEVLAGAHPLRGLGVADGIARLKTDPRFEPPHALAPAVPPALSSICLTALAPDPARRYPDGEALALALDAWLDGARPPAPPAPPPRRARAVVVVALGAVALLGLLALALRQPPAPPPDKGERQPPRLRLDDPPPRDTFSATLALAGAVEDASPWVDVGLTGAAPLRVAGAARFALEAALALGENRLQLVARDRAGNAATLDLRVVRHAAPAWLLALPADRRPPAPLPAGLAFGDRAGEYARARDGQLYAWIPPGRFTMGTRRGEENEGPPHEVRLSRGLFLGRTEVTCAQLERFRAAAGRDLPPRREGAGPDHPAQDVSWLDAAAYCAWAGARLPSEAEWERAARGDDGRLLPWGDAPPDPRRCALLFGERGSSHTVPVGSCDQGASPYGCLDLVGNVWEWVDDGYALFGPEPAVDPRARFDGFSRTLRGGGWNTPAGHARSTLRSGRADGVRDAEFGLRVALDPG